jgi:hypothetical protein
MFSSEVAAIVLRDAANCERCCRGAIPNLSGRLEPIMGGRYITVVGDFEELS